MAGAAAWTDPATGSEFVFAFGGYSEAFTNPTRDIYRFLITRSSRICLSSTCQSRYELSSNQWQDLDSLPEPVVGRASNLIVGDAIYMENGDRQKHLIYDSQSLTLLD